ncbi:DUF7537 family lipoprotein [Haloprofundus halobius]|uniref:DUF7537 family lipoprotein n=1 Tax=Haloprofundus halobius TaxID=2876194 RepID=UPI001CCF29E2|nr:hypothetical protein [Haloprofundus halobius]
MPSKAALLAVVALVLLSGCGGLLNDFSQRQPREDHTSDPRWLAPGLTSDGVINAKALIQTHRKTVSSQARTSTQTQVFRAENGTVVANTTLVTRVMVNRGPKLAEERSKGPKNVTNSPKRSFIWYDPKTSELATYSKSDDGEVHYTYRQSDRVVLVQNGTHSKRLYTLFRLLNATVAPETIDDSVHRLEASTQQLSVNGEKLQNVSFTAHIDYTGIVRSYELQYETERGGMMLHVTERMRITDLGITKVSRPEWVERSKNQSEQTADD